MASEWETHTSLTATDDGLFGAELDPGWVAVSYTHLTLPTIYSV